jgi:integrase
MRTATGRTCWTRNGRLSNPRGALRDCRPGWQRKAHSDRSCSTLGETRRRCVDHGGWHQWRAIFRRVSRLDKIWGDGITPKAIWHVVKAAAKRADIKNLAPHDLRRTCARLCHLAGGELEQIQFLLGHASVQTTERYLGCKQKLGHAVNDNLGLEDT